MSNEFLNFDERLERGKRAEIQFENRCLDEGIMYLSTKDSSSWNSELDKIIGDYIIFDKDNNVFKIDVKGGSISKESMNCFKGDYFVIYSNSNGSAVGCLVAPSKVLKDLICNFKNYDFDRLPSGDLGILYSRLKALNNLFTLDQFINWLKL